MSQGIAWESLIRPCPLLTLQARGRPAFNRITGPSGEGTIPLGWSAGPGGPFWESSDFSRVFNRNHTAFGVWKAGSMPARHSNRGFSSMNRASGGASHGTSTGHAPSSGGQSGGHTGSGGGHMGGGGGSSRGGGGSWAAAGDVDEKMDPFVGAHWGFLVWFLFRTSCASGGRGILYEPTGGLKSGYRGLQEG